MKKAKSGSSLGMKSVKAGYDKNPGVTRADIIVAGKKQAKKGMKVKKAENGFRATNKQRTKGSEPLTEYYPKINRGSGNLIPVGATKNPKTGKPLRPADKKLRGGGTISPSKSSTSTRLSTYGRPLGKNLTGKAKGGAKMMKKCKYGC